MKKVNFLDINLRKEFLEKLSLISTILSLILIFYDIPVAKKCILGGLFVVLLIVFYIALWIKANKLSLIHLTINNSEIEVKIGDIFQEEGIKVIAFNEYFDTFVDDRIISRKSLNGIFINKIINSSSKEIFLKKLDNLIENDLELKSNCQLEYNYSRILGKKQKYKLGSIFEYKDEYFLTAMTKFDSNNRAILSQKEFIEFLLTFWDNIDKKYNSRTIILPVLGSGITRFADHIEISEQELLNTLIWTFKLSRIKFTYPSKIKIVIYKDKKDKINLYKLKELENI